MFAGFTTYDTRKTKAIHFRAHGDAVAAAEMAIMGALNLNLDFVNMFLLPLRLLGAGRGKTPGRRPGRFCLYVM